MLQTIRYDNFTSDFCVFLCFKGSAALLTVVVSSLQSACSKSYISPSHLNLVSQPYPLPDDSNCIKKIQTMKHMYSIASSEWILVPSFTVHFY